MSSRRRGCVGLCAAALLCAGAVAALGEEVVERRVVVMGTSLDVSLVAGNRAEGLEASEAVVEEVRRIEDLLTTWRDSPLFRLNGAPVGEPAFIGEEIAAVLSEILRWASRTDRAFDPTVAPLMRVWDLRGKGRIPSSQEIAAAVAATAPENFRIDVEHGRAARLHPDAGIDEGAWGKGYALDRAARRLADAGIANALLDLGGQTLALGHDSSAADWRIWIAHPRQRERPVVELSLSNLSASTSGNSERGRIVSGRRIGHELDPRSGEPAPDFGSATVVASSALVADILSTAFFVLGPEKGLALSERLRREGVPQEVLFLIDRGRRLRAIASKGFSNRVASADLTIVDGLTIPTP